MRRGSSTGNFTGELPLILCGDALGENFGNVFSGEPDVAVASAVIVAESTVCGCYKTSDAAGGLGSSPKFITSMSMSSYCVMQPREPVVVLL